MTTNGNGVLDPSWVKCLLLLGVGKLFIFVGRFSWGGVGGFLLTPEWESVLFYVTWVNVGAQRPAPMSRARAFVSPIPGQREGIAELFQYSGFSENK